MSFGKFGARYDEELETKKWSDFAALVRGWHNGRCDVCRRNDVPLQVHHKFYRHDRKAWEYEPDEVMVLCSGCHREVHEQLRNFRRYVMGALKPGEFKILNGALAVAFKNYGTATFCRAIAELAKSPSLVKRFAELYASPEEGIPYNATERDYDERERRDWNIL